MAASGLGVPWGIRENWASIEDVSAFLGHRNTATYLARMEREDDNGWQGVAQALGVA